MDSAKICLLVLACVCAAVVLKQWKSDLLPLLRLGMILSVSFLLISAAAPLVNTLRELGSTTGIAEGTEVLCKALGIAILTQCCSNICNECGENSAATGVELAGKLEILLLCLPLLENLLNVAKTMLEELP